MGKDKKTFYSSVSRQSKKLALRNGIRYALPGAMLLLLLMFFQKTLFVSLFLFCAAIALVAIGFFPYKKIMYLENNPIVVNFYADRLVFKPKSHEVTIPFVSIEGFDFVESPTQYGIKVKSKEGQFFLPYFFKEDFEEMKRLMGRS